MMNPTLRLLPPLFLLGALACGGSTPPPTSSGSGDVLALPPSTATAATTGAPAPADTASAAPAASSAPAKTVRAPSGGGPMAVTENEKEVSAPYGPRGGLSRLTSTGAELTIPRDAVNESYGFLFALNAGKNALKVTPYKGALGDMYRVFVFRESASNEGVAMTSGGAPFLIKLPLKGAKTANLAVGTVTEGKVSKYAVVAPKSVLEGDGPSFAVFELPALPGEAIVQLTTQPPAP